MRRRRRREERKNREEKDKENESAGCRILIRSNEGSLKSERLCGRTPLQTRTHAHPLTHVGPIDLLEPTLLWAIMLFTRHGKSISLLSFLANTRKGNLLSLDVRLPVSIECVIGNLCFRSAVMLLSHITLNRILKKKKKTSKEK